MTDGRYWLQTLGCAKNEVDTAKLEGLLTRDGYASALSPTDADVIVVNTCAFIEAARQESIDMVLALADLRRPGARLVVTGCMAERYGAELASALPEVDLVAGFGQALVAPLTAQQSAPHTGPHAAPHTGQPTGQIRAPVQLRPRAHRRGRGGQAPATAGVESFDLLNLARPASKTPWAYVKVASGCDRRCGFCAIPSFRGAQRSRTPEDILSEVRQLAGDETMPVREVVLVAQDLASYGRDRATPGRTAHAPRTALGPKDPTPLVTLVGEVAKLVERTRLLYLYPSGLTDELVDAICASGVPYFDLSLQHVSRPLLRRMRRVGSGERFLERIERIRAKVPDATCRSSFILGYPGETEDDHDQLLEFLGEAQLDWAGFFTFSREEGTYADGLVGQVPAELALERLRECSELQDAITGTRRDALVGRDLRVLVDAPGVGRSVHEAPEIDGVVRVPDDLAVGSLVDVRVVESLGTDLVAVRERPGAPQDPGAAALVAGAGAR